MEPTVTMANSNLTMEDAEEILADMRTKLEYRMRMYTVAHLNSGNLEHHANKMEERELILENLNLSTRKFIGKFSSQLCQERVDEIKTQLSVKENEFLIYRESFSQKVVELKILSINSSTSSVVPSINNIALQDSFQVQQNAAKKKVKAKIDAIVDDLVDLSAKAGKVEDWTVVTDLTVERAMKENEKLKIEFSKINAARRVVEELMAEFDLDGRRDNVSILECDLKLIKVRQEVEATIKAVEEQDTLRELYSLDEVKVDKMKLPIFSGMDSEDYEKFKSDLLKGFAQNRVTQADKLAKLRECLSGEAKRLVPQSISSKFDEAMKVLDQAYGDPFRLFRYRREPFFKLGKQPKEDDKSGFKGLVEWLRDAEVALQSLYALALKDETCAAQLFSPNEMKGLLQMFDSREFKKLVKCEGFGESKFKRWLTMVGEFRESAQRLATSFDRSLEDPKVLINVGNCTKRNKSSKASQSSLTMFKLPRRHDKCRICNHLRNKGDNWMLFDNHLSNHPTGCPRYIGMNIEERNKLCKYAKICIKCNNPSYVFQFADIQSNDKHKCVSRNSRSCYNCQNPSCNVHIWCCLAHQPENEEILKRLQQEIRSKFNLEFCINVKESIATEHSMPNDLADAKNQWTMLSLLFFKFLKKSEIGIFHRVKPSRR